MKSLFILGVMIVWAPIVYAASGMTVTDAWVQAVPPSQKTSAVYMTINNDSNKPQVLISASSEAARVAEIHQMSEMNGMMHMAMKAQISIPASSKISLKPGGFHLMLIDLKESLHEGEIISVILNFEDGGHLMVNAKVKMQEDDHASSMAGMKM